MAFTYKCPNCGAMMEYDAEKNSLSCSYCQTTKSVAEMEEEAKDELEKAAEEKPEEVMLAHYHCQSCGAEILTDEHTIAAFCSYCGNSSLLKERVSGEQKPSSIIPFKVTRETAVAQFRKWTRNGLLTPKDFTSTNTIEKITGTYVPFWLYDYGADVEMDADCTRVRVSRKGDMEYTYTDHYAVSRRIRAVYEKIPADASEKMDDEAMQKVEPYDYGGLKAFELPYLSGYLAEKYNFDSKQLADIAKGRVREYASAACRDTISGYATVSVHRQNIRLQERKADYVLMPVWMLNYRYKDKDYHFFLNGQTGKLVGNLPVSYRKVAGWFAGISAGAFLLLTIIGGLL